jgi:hypothetical protein
MKDSSPIENPRCAHVPAGDHAIERPADDGIARRQDNRPEMFERDVRIAQVVPATVEFETPMPLQRGFPDYWCLPTKHVESSGCESGA